MKRSVIIVAVLLALIGTAVFSAPPFGNLGTTNLWTALNTFQTSIAIKGSSSGSITIAAPAAAGSNMLTLPAGTTDLSGTGGTSQVVKQTSSGGALTVAQLAYSDISGSAPAAAAGTLTGTTLASNVVTSSLTSVGTLATLGVSGAETAGTLSLGGCPLYGVLLVESTAGASCTSYAAETVIPTIMVGLRADATASSIAQRYSATVGWNQDVPNTGTLTWYYWNGTTFLDRIHVTSAGALTMAAGITAQLATAGTIAGSICQTAAGILLYESGATGCVISLEELKRDIAPITGAEALADIRALHPITYNMKEPANAPRRLGLGAHQVEGVDKRLATYDGDGKLQGWDPNGVLAATVVVVQQQQATIVWMRAALIVGGAWMLLLTGAVVVLARRR